MKGKLEDVKNRYDKLTADLKESEEKQKADSDKANEFYEEIIIIEKWIVTIVEVIKTWDEKGVSTDPDEIKKQLRETEVRNSLLTWYSMRCRQKRGLIYYDQP